MRQVPSRPTIRFIHLHPVLDTPLTAQRCVAREAIREAEALLEFCDAEEEYRAECDRLDAAALSAHHEWRGGQRHVQDIARERAEFGRCAGGACNV